MKRVWTCLAIGMTAVVMGMAPLSAKAANLKIWMDEFKQDYLPVNGISTTHTSYQNPATFGMIAWPSVETISYGWAPVNLPVGTVIKSMVYYHGGSFGNSTSCDLVGVKFGKDGSVLSSASSKAASPTTVTLSAMDASTSTIKDGFRYFVRVIVGSGTNVRGVKITY